MTVPTAPFSTTKQVAYLLLNLFPGTGVNLSDPDFDGTTVPSSTVVTTIRTLKSGMVQMEFANVGYKIPFEVAPGEEWPTHQTNFLALLEALGVAGDLANSIKPAPGRATSSGPAFNMYQTMFYDWQKIIRESGAGLRANYWTGSKAEQWLMIPRGPTTEFTANYPDNYADPARFGLLLENLSALEDQFDDMAKRKLNWDYVYELR